MTYLLDTNILLRWIFLRDSKNAEIRAALKTLRRRGAMLYCTPQTLIECWNALTRPVNVNGFGLLPAQAAIKISRLMSVLPLLPDTSAVFGEWLYLVTTLGVSGRQVHDARLVALMRVHGLSHILTYNGADFARYPGIVAVHPGSV